MGHSKLQLEVLRLYKELLRAATNKPGFQSAIRTEFRRQAGLARTDTLRIEYQLRMGRRKLETIRDPQVGNTTISGLASHSCVSRLPTWDSLCDLTSETK